MKGMRPRLWAMRRTGMGGVKRSEGRKDERGERTRGEKGMGGEKG